MRIQPCNQPAGIRLCASCGRNPELRNPITGAAMPGLNPTTRAERCFDWYSAPTQQQPAVKAR